MLLILNEFGTAILAWAENCDCHAWLKPIPRKKRDVFNNVHSENAQLLELCRSSLGLAKTTVDGIRMGPCPLAGMRAPELAAGEIEVFIENLFSTYMEQIIAFTPDGDTDVTLGDFVSGKYHILALLREKLRFWQTMPWKMAALGLRDVSKAREIAASILREFLESPQEEQLHSHLTWAWLGSPEAPIRQQLELFIRGHDLHQLPDLCRLVWELKFMPVVERCQEADHSILHRKGSTRSVTAPYVSLTLRMPELVAMFDEPAVFKEFMSCFEQIEKLDSAAMQLGFHRHPRWKAARERKAKRQEKHLLAQAIMYGLDGETQFKKLSGGRNKREEQSKAKKICVEVPPPNSST